MIATDGSRITTLASAVLLATVTLASGAQPPSVETRLQQLEQEVFQLREENRRQQFEIESRSQGFPTLLFAQIPSSDPVAIPAVYDDFSSSPNVPSESIDEFQRLATDIEQTKLSFQRLQSKVDQLGDAMTVSLLNKQWSATVTGAMIGEMIFSEQRPVIPSAIVLLSPDLGKNTPTIDVHGKSSKIGMIFRGPDYRGLQTGGAMLAYFFGEDFLADVAGINNPEIPRLCRGTGRV